ncbi:unnamed protein product [Candidatus Protochlamydia amoebophila UWE25]|uniref:Uncharacterized protein n=1 Tax=Protochlamydia amoebophila (strain UWE25) TaxID=264201 RepID=Q6M9T4_PARUW|nr:unnamed protein product [Candidatus Protochlamydia amoebophila UWE25]
MKKQNKNSILDLGISHFLWRYGLIISKRFLLILLGYKSFYSESHTKTNAKSAKNSRILKSKTVFY